MALNDYADREVDAVERPQRPIPSGRVQADFALHLAQALTAAGVVTAGLAGGRRSLAVAVPLAATIWAYDLGLKNTPAGPVAMAACRALDVLLGASPAALAPALAPAAVVGGHTLAVTVVSRHEAAGGSPAVGRGAVCAAAGVTVAAGAFAIRRLRGAPRVRALAPSAAGLLAVYASSFGRASVDAARDPSAPRLQRVVGAGVLGLIPLEAAMLVGVGRPATAGGLASLWPLARQLSRRRSVT
jgi:4-hydroxybenzoate polyprenyltransferase